MTLDRNDDRVDWLALLRVRQGRISEQDGRYLHHGQAFPEGSHVAAALHRLAAAGMFTASEPDEQGRVTLAVTAAGQARYRELDTLRRQPSGDATP